MNRMALALFLFASSLAAAACGGGGGEAPPATAPGAAAPSAGGAGGAAAPSSTAPFAEQAAAGKQLYTEHCASCHGASGEGVKAPKLVGIASGALPLDPPPTAKYRKTQFKTAADVAGFVVKAMPPNAPGSLKEDEYWAILAFDLQANGVDLGSKHLDATTAASVAIH